MKETKLNLNTPCPACDGRLSPTVLSCGDCGTEIKGPIAPHPLFQLDSEMLHFLMVFIHCGGKIGDMEKALGISYPTVKSQLAKLQEKVASSIEKLSLQENSALEILNKIERGDLPFEEALDKIKKMKTEKK